MQSVPLYTAQDGYIGMAQMDQNDKGEPEMFGFVPTRRLPRNLALALSRLEDEAPDYIGFQEDPEFNAIRVFNKRFPEIVLAISHARNNYRVEYWDPDDTDRDYTVYHGPNLNVTISTAIIRLSG